MRISAVAAVVIGVCAACSPGAQHVRPGPGTVREAVAPVALRPTPEWAADACETVEGPRGSCPTEIPATPKRGWQMTFTGPHARSRMAVWQLQSGTEWGGFGERVHRPPVFANLVSMRGAFMRQDSKAFPPSGAPVIPVHDGMANGNRHHPINLGPRTWSDHRGELSLTPSIYAAEGPLADLTVFRWRDAAGQHALGVNVWEPITQSVQTLHAIVDRVAPGSPPSPRPRRIGTADGMPMVSAPGWVGELCRASRIARPACPHALPMVGMDGGDVSIQPWPAWPGQGRVRSSWMSVTWSGPGIPSPNDAHPPAFGHFEVTAGYVRRAAHYAHRIPLARITIPAGYIESRPIPLGIRPWTARPGRLIFGDCFANHLCYRWREHERTYQVDLHAWYPLAQTVAVLHAMVASSPAGAERRERSPGGRSDGV
jgi:hypothetical protein